MMKKNLFLVIVAIILAIATITVGVLLIVKNMGEAQLSVGNAKGIVGDTVEVPIIIDKNPGIWGGQIIIDYDSDNFSYVSISNGDVFDYCESNDTGDSVVIVANTLLTQAKLENTYEDGVVATLKFKIKSSAKKGDYNISVNTATNFCNNKEEIIEVAFVDGIIKVK